MMTVVNRWIIIALIQIIGSALGQVPSLGKCPPNVKSVAEFDLAAYLGKWYEYSKYPFIFEAGGKCITAFYGMNDRNQVTVHNAQVNMITGKPSSIDGTADLTPEPGQLLVRFNSVPSFVGSSNYWVLGTDYTSYAVVYSCSEFIKNTFHTTVVWILTRAQNPLQLTIDAANRVIDANQLSRKFMTRTTQTNCPNE